MPKKFIKRYLPHPEKIKNTKGFGLLGKWLHEPNIWHLNRQSVSKATIIGLFWMSIPIPGQMVTAALSAILFRANLPISVALVWISNPLTLGPIFYFNYVVGSLILGQEADENIQFQLSWDWLINVLGDLWLPLYLGSAVVGITLGLVAYLVIQILWRIHVINNWKNRKKTHGNRHDNK